MKPEGNRQRESLFWYYIICLKVFNSLQTSKIPLASLIHTWDESKDLGQCFLGFNTVIIKPAQTLRIALMFKKDGPSGSLLDLKQFMEHSTLHVCPFLPKNGCKLTLDWGYSCHYKAYYVTMLRGIVKTRVLITSWTGHLSGLDIGLKPLWAIFIYTYMYNLLGFMFFVVGVFIGIYNDEKW